MDSVCRMIATAHRTIKSFNVDPLGTQTELWSRAFNTAPPYAKETLTAQGATTPEAWAQGFNECLTNKKDGFDPVMMPIDVAKIVLACADGSTKSGRATASPRRLGSVATRSSLRRFSTRARSVPPSCPSKTRWGSRT